MIFPVSIPESLKQTLLWRSAVEIIHVLRENGFSAWLVGGAPRDILSGKTPKDLDIATSARPEEIQKLFPDSLPLGASFGVVVILKNAFQFETATLREERLYEDGRHPEDVCYTTDPMLDVQRRDFTINAMLLDPENETVLDYTGGLADLKRGIVRTVGDAKRRFSEDYLRILRA